MTQTDPMSANDHAGSINGTGPNPNNPGDGQPGNSGVDFEKMYKELEQKLGAQGSELGEYRSFFEGIAPLLDKLDKNPELVQAIINGAVDDTLAKAVSDGRVSVGDAKTIAQEANANMKKDGGINAKSTPEDIAKIVDEKVSMVKKEVEDRIKETEELRSYENKTNAFIDNTADFAKYANDIDKYLDSHPNVDDIETAYYAVKGKVLESEAAKRAEEEKAEYEKNLAQNAAGGGRRVGYIPEGSDEIDNLIAGKANPNIF